MKLTLHPANTIRHQPAASFIRGHSAMEWLEQISRYQVPLSSLDCYVLPQSIHSVAPAGLLVIFKNSSEAAKLDLPDAYGVLAEKLYLPVQSHLYPQVLETELKKLLLWPVQVFHPSIGFIGFEEKDRLNGTQLFAWCLPQKTTWRHAHAGLLPAPPLQQILVQQPTPEEVMQSVREAMNAKPLEDIPGATESETTALEKWLDKAKYGLFKGILSISEALGKLMPDSGTGEGTAAGNENASDKPGLLDKVQQWLKQNMEALEKKRQNELQRLMDLFDTNTDEALQYAIPLDSPYLDRGVAAPSSTLSRRPLDFNLNRLGGGGRVDGWDIGDYYQSLRSKYLESAQAAIQKGDYKKAAYIHAHLLGDFNAAANVLMQGGFYREAAALYKDHLKNITAAAECLEKGGLLTEATELYIQLERLEKAGDLYRQMGQHGKAENCYEKRITSLLDGRDNLEASRIIYEKMQQAERTKEVLLQGWESSSKGEACLKKYYDIVAATESENMVHHLEAVYVKQAAADSRFLNVLVHVRERHGNEDVAKASQKMAYEIVSRQATNGDTSGLHQLKTFIPDDKLITGDTSRFIQSRPKPQISKPTDSVRLDRSIKWLDATWHRNQVIAVGIKDGNVHLARANWYGNIEYTWWPQTGIKNTGFHFINNNILPYILLRCPGDFSIFKKTFTKSKYFNEEIAVDYPAWLPAHHESMMVHAEGFTLLKTGNQTGTLEHYKTDGILISSVNCTPANGEVFTWNTYSAKLDFWSGYYFTSSDKHLVLIKEDGTYTGFDAGSGIRMFAVSKLSAITWVAVSTNAGCSLLIVKAGRFRECNRFEISSNTTAIRFLTQDTFITLEKMKATLYEAAENATIIKRHITTESPIIEAIPVPHQNQFGLVHQNGVISIHEL